MEYFDENYQLLPFNDDRHLDNHLNYLLRTDYKQKWTNEITETNLIFCLSKNVDGIKVVRIEQCGDLENRKSWKKKIINTFRHNQLNYQRVFMCLKECLSDEIEWNEAIVNDMKKFLEQTFLNFHSSNETLYPLIAVSHFDQTQDICHFHILFISPEK